MNTNKIESIEFIIKLDNFIEVDTYIKNTTNNKFTNFTTYVYNDGTTKLTKSTCDTTFDYLLTRINFCKDVYDAEGYSRDVIIYYNDDTVDYLCYDGMKDVNE